MFFKVAYFLPFSSKHAPKWQIFDCIPMRMRYLPPAFLLVVVTVRYSFFTYVARLSHLSG